MIWLTSILLLFCVVYLVYAIVKPERF